MEMEEDATFPSADRIPIDYTITKSSLALTGCDLTVHDARGDLLYRIDGRGSGSSSHRVRTLFDAAGDPLITIVHNKDEWQAFKGYSMDWKDIVFTARTASTSAFKNELNVFMTSENSGDSKELKPSLRLIGSPFRRSCTIIMADSIVAQANLLYRLRKVIYSRNKFRFTVYPGSDPVLLIAMLVTFLGVNGQREKGNWSIQLYNRCYASIFCCPYLCIVLPK
ncbi:protein LURP-one-related 7 [Typha angustifolia]|uniref:protein LURP-one-related 7 n=1 Tax=Typha angustifolia TaxID=59011 RepID=UPI003C2DAE44